jgi:hypothetical protein
MPLLGGRSAAIRRGREAFVAQIDSLGQSGSTPIVRRTAATAGDIKTDISNIRSDIPAGLQAFFPACPTSFAINQFRKTTDRSATWARDCIFSQEAEGNMKLSNAFETEQKAEERELGLKAAGYQAWRKHAPDGTWQVCWLLPIGGSCAAQI